MAFKSSHDVTLRAGEAFEARDPYGHLWRFVSQGISTSETRDRNTTRITLDTWRDGEHSGFITAEKRLYRDTRGQKLFEEATEVGIKTSAKLDTYVVLAGLRDRETAELSINFNPLVVWVWIGGFVMMIGGLIVMWPQAERRPRQGGYAAVLSPEGASADVPAAV
jgi:cytochrome c-type biogenesis protein CcmF